MLHFHNDIIEQALKQKSGAWILSPGLGLYSILENLLLKLEETKPEKLIIVLNIDSNPVFEHFIHTPPHRFKLVNSNYTSDQRKSLWLSGGILFVTPRVLIVDILNKILPCQIIGGIIIPLPYYYCISDSTVESFICNLYNQYLRSKSDVYNKSNNNNIDIITASQIVDDNKSENTSSISKSTYDGFIKVFSDNPRQFYGSYSKFQEQLESFKLRKVFIWPRFRDEVIKSLNKSPDVVELMAHMPTFQRKIHDTIKAVMKMCIDEIHRMNLMIDTSMITLDNALFRSFYVLLKSNIDPVYHKLSKKFKQLIRDLDVLRRMLNYLMQLDAVSFYEKIYDLKKEINEDSIFLLLDETHQIFELSQARIYQITQKDNVDGSKDSNITLNLEDNPKIHILDDILKEIDSLVENKNEHVLVLVKDIRTCEMVSSYLCFNNKEYFTLNLFKNYLLRSSSKHQPYNSSKKSLLNKDSTINLHSIPSLMSAVLECENQNGISFSNSNNRHDIDFDKYFGLFPQNSNNGYNLNVIIHPFKDARRSLYDFKPKFIILYDPNLTMVREIEVYKSSHPGLPVRVYFTVFKDSIEEIKYKNSIQDEKIVFESIVKEKANMVFTEESTHELTLKEKLESRPTIIVDVREFRSKLPVILNSNKINIVPQQLLIADYILTPKMAVERKSISDLFQSFSSGRLYNQMQQMCRHYEIPILLIEFDQNMPFRLQTQEDMTDHITPSAISSKITLITKNFPKMRIIWTRSPYETAQIFIELKKNNPQPDPSIYESSFNQDDGSNDIFEPIDVLKKLPGINDENFHKFLSKTQTKESSSRFEVKDTTLSSIASMTKEELISLIDVNNGTILYNFLHNDPFDT